jgi:spermidine synthase
MDHWSTQITSVFLLGLGLAVALVFVSYSGSKTRKAVFGVECAICIVLAFCSHSLFSSMFERLLFKTDYKPGMRFSALVENRSGVIAVYNEDTALGYKAETVYGGGAYDGRFNTDILHDSNGLFRAYAITAMGPAARHILMIGLASGSWAQVIANDPELEDLTVVEINPGYLPLIAGHDDVKSLLNNPKVHIVIDDGRRWMLANKDNRFDYIVMNTTFNWRANGTNLLSKDFLELARQHLNPGGVLYYNTTWSRQVFATGLAEFKYALRVSNFLALSDSPLSLDKQRWRKILSEYRLDGRPIVNLDDPAQRARLESVLILADEADELDAPAWKLDLESRASIEARTRGARLITDDNMGTEWLTPEADSIPYTAPK